MYLQNLAHNLTLVNFFLTTVTFLQGNKKKKKIRHFLQNIVTSLFIKIVILSKIALSVFRIHMFTRENRRCDAFFEELITGDKVQGYSLQ